MAALPRNLSRQLCTLSAMITERRKRILPLSLPLCHLANPPHTHHVLIQGTRALGVCVFTTSKNLLKIY